MEQDALGKQNYFVESIHESDPPESEEESTEEEELSNEDSNVPFGEQMNLPRRSRRIAVLELLVSFADTEPLENHRTVDSEASLLHMVLCTKSVITDPSQRTSGSNNMLIEVAIMQRNSNKDGFLKNDATSFVLN